jgi:hypothetical protein
MKTLSKTLRAALGGAESMREVEFLGRCKREGLPPPATQYRVIPGRRYRWDFAWPGYKVCVELHGGVWQQGAHNRGWGVRRDAEKARLAQLAGWIALSFTPDDGKDGLDAVVTGDALWQRGWNGSK